MYKRVVVALDRSPEAEKIVPFILQIAGPLDMEVILVSVNQPIPPTVTDAAIPFTVEDPVRARAEAEEYLRPIVAALRDRCVRAEMQVRRGQPAEEIVATAVESGADLIAMTTHGRGSLGHLLFGSVAADVLRRSPLPVFLMRMTAVPAAGSLATTMGRGSTS